MNTRHLFAGLTIVMLIFAFSCVSPTSSSTLAATETFQETYAVKADTPLTVANRNGSVTITTWERDTVEVVAVKKPQLGANPDHVEIRVTVDDAMRIETVYLVNNPRVSVEYTISVPVSMSIMQAESSNGTITLTGTTGDVTIHTSNGGINISQHTGVVDADTSNGSIVMRQISGAVTAKTSNGRIEIRQAAGLVNAKTSNGKITITESGGIAEAKTSNGGIEAEIAEIAAGGVTLTTSNGRITLWLSPALNATLNLTTSNGKIAIHDFEIITTSVSKTALIGRIGNGGNPLTATTSNGGIDVYGLN